MARDLHTYRGVRRNAARFERKAVNLESGSQRGTASRVIIGSLLRMIPAFRAPIRCTLKRG
jgi:hypothetical protein